MDRGGYAYVSPEVKLNVTCANAGFVNDNSSGVFYKLSNGEWRLKFNMCLTQNATNAAAVTIVGVVFKNVANFYQGIACPSSTNTVYNTYAYTNIGTSTIQLTFSGNTINLRASGDVALNGKPTAYLPEGV